MNFDAEMNLRSICEYFVIKYQKLSHSWEDNL